MPQYNVTSTPTSKLLHWQTHDGAASVLTIADILAAVTREFPGVPNDKLIVLAVSCMMIQVMQIP